MDKMAIIWAVLVVVFAIVEAATAGLASIWFAAGAIVSLLSTFCGAPIWLQILLFIIVSIVTLILTRPLALKYVNNKTKATNADRTLGQTATVTQRIDNVAGTGMVSVGGRVWTARSADGTVIEEGSRTVVRSIEGVKAIVACADTVQYAER